MDDYEKELIHTLRSRYGTLRSEVLMRIDYRYKLIQISLVFTTVAVTLIWKLEWYYVGFVATFFCLSVAALLISESRQIIFLSDYLSKIDEELDDRLNSPIIGWEKLSRFDSYAATKGTNKITATLVFLFSIIYTAFSVLGLHAVYLDTGSLGLCLVLGLVVLSIPIPVFWAIRGAHRAYWTKASSRIRARPR